MKLDINKLARALSDPRAKVGPNHIQWSQTCTGEMIASGLITVNIEHTDEGWLRIQMGSLDQRIDLSSQPRRFGGRQWYFRCPVTRRFCSSLWMPPGATRFGSGKWRQVGYASQFETPADRAHRGQAKIKSRLIGTCDPDDWDLPPKPSWMRWSTYIRHVERFDGYADTLDDHLVGAVARLRRHG